MDWQQYRKFYASKHGSASLQTISVAYQAYKNGKTKKTSTKTSTKSSPHKLTGKKSLQLQEILKNLPKTRHHRIAALKEQMQNKGEGRGSATRGWAAAAPQKGYERHQLKKICGDKAFLNPSKEGFPIMSALRNTGGKCKITCQGVEAAHIRACQWNHCDIAQKAVDVGIKNCGWSKNTPSCRSNKCRI
jgi:hypothetical protein